MSYNKPLDNAEQEQSVDNFRLFKKNLKKDKNPNQDKSNTRHAQINEQKDQESLKNKDGDR